MIEKQNIIRLKKRSIIKVTGEEATDFLQSLITTDVKKIGLQEIFPGALLSPQGKVIADFLIGKIKDGYLIDIFASLADILQKRLLLYKLRRKVEITQPLQEVVTVFLKNEETLSDYDSSFIDKRFPPKEKIIRIYGNTPFFSSEDHHNWDRLRIRYAIAESGQDYEIGKVFPHDINYDQIGGLAFNKGCYIGQEVVSRMHHRRAARRRILTVKSQHELTSGSNVEAETKILGYLGTCVANEALALMRLDHVKDAMNRAIALTVKNAPVTISIAENMNFTFPENSVET
ncbi:folate-binding protein YgfZ [Bartonella vinsonii subsp. arupensis OK-94-513]|uniref:Folate-binding protein YgfZ n=2 Tax=Bartonella vinsonii subsp. arupensis TaxID=110578 RepID=J0ZG27_BARVI|nr:folate-binding protein YgfZ [Bartonella vinsonii]EJF87028.1 folate-binding protein YgfZ [Bartonella vinsonii subsp. arupensis OK-94-513]EJF98738.1 folate-binding protein YgfZ [Bartonella vinsonii subsp. arupensis Pm136co]